MAVVHSRVVIMISKDIFSFSYSNFNSSYSDILISRSDFPISHSDFSISNNNHWDSIGDFQLNPLLSSLACHTYPHFPKGPAHTGLIIRDRLPKRKKKTMKATKLTSCMNFYGKPSMTKVGWVENHLSSLSDRYVRLRNHCARLENHYVRLEKHCMRN